MNEEYYKDSIKYDCSCYNCSHDFVIDIAYDVRYGIDEEKSNVRCPKCESGCITFCFA